ncbi:MAG: OmpA family protein [Elusimicrobiota bacterium]
MRINKRMMRNMIDANDPKVAQIGHPAPPWMVNYADLMTELVCFFIILYALSAALSKGMVDAKEQLEEMMKEKEMQGQVEMTKEGMRVTLEEKEGSAYFEVGKADITQQGIGILDMVAPILAGLPNDVLVEGHTDNSPIHTSQYDSNWELSTARATNVVKYMVTQKSIAPNRIAAVGYGEYKPVIPNDSLENRKKNRRVVFFIKNK